MVAQALVDTQERAVMVLVKLLPQQQMGPVVVVLAAEWIAA